MTQRRATCGSRSRRSFLKTTAAALPALGVTGVHAAGDDTIRLGLIGCGERGTGAAIQALGADRGARLVAVADIFAGHAPLAGSGRHAILLFVAEEAAWTIRISHSKRSCAS